MTEELPWRVRNLLKRMRESGQTLMITLSHPQGYTLNYPVYSLHPSGIVVGTLTAENAIESGELVSGDDGLIDGLAQTWRIKA